MNCSSDSSSARRIIARRGLPCALASLSRVCPAAMSMTSPQPARLSWTKPSRLLVTSLRLSVSQDHPHFSCTTPAVEVRECRQYGRPVVPSATILRTRRKVRRLKSKDGRGASPEQEVPFGRRLRRLRESAGLTQEELAEKADLSAKGISDLERGERRRPYPNTVRSLADALELSENERATLVAVVPGRGAAHALPLQRSPNVFCRHRQPRS